MQRSRLGWIGVGKMGTPLCTNLLEAGFDLSVVDTDPGRVAAITRSGARSCPDAATLAREVDVVFSMVPDDAALLAIVAGANGVAAGIGPGKIFVDLSTVSPARSAKVAEMLRPTGAQYLRSPVSGSVATAAAGTLAIYCSGPLAAFETVRPALERMGRTLTYCGGEEEARVLKLVINMIVCITPAVVGEALSLGARSGLDWSSMIDAIGQSVAASPVIGYKADMMKRRDWTPMATIDLVAKDLDLALEWGRLQHAPMPLTGLVQQINTAFQASGDGELDFFSILTWPERLAKA
jgi:3-hydroxyisobutyrate dehydrogenase-like beta-hydroxyacid dehydrogenase